MLVIGIDPGMASTGYGLVHQLSNGQLDLVDYGLISTAAGQPLPVRLLDLYSDLLKVLKNYRPDSAAVEKLFFRRNVSTALTVGQARGVAMLTLAMADVQVEEYTPSEVKLAVSGYGNAGKQQMQAMVKALLKMDNVPTPDDAADALAVAICHCHSHKIRHLGEEA
ncbi:MAG: crossover junction endodeoxyribonuclease RuvC [Chloroflexi bacterium RBG_16_48_8]|nr:MAG: crossover junction endodeoxyribonuclease RuvC [Chloroflexi bacterium RBG_16_48_8]